MEINKEILFAQKLESVRQQAKKQGNCISEQKVRTEFEELTLKEEQFELVFDYLKKHKIGLGEPVDLDDYLSSEEINYLEEYHKELALLKQVSKGEREAVILSSMAGERQAQQRLIEVFLPQVVEIAKLYTGQGVFIEDLIGEGNVALSIGVTMLGCLENADEADGMLGRMIMDAMEESITDAVKAENADKIIAEKVNKVARQAKELAENLQRRVTAEELSQETGMTEKEIIEVMHMSGSAIEDLEG